MAEREKSDGWLLSGAIGLIAALEFEQEDRRSGEKKVSSWSPVLLSNNQHDYNPITIPSTPVAID